MFLRKEKNNLFGGRIPAGKEPVIRSSICTGEKVAGFIDSGSGVFEDVMLLSSPADLEKFRKAYGITGEIRTIY